LVVGLIVVLVVQYAPQGLAGLLERLFSSRRRMSAAASDAMVVKEG
jgi:hypothetical protein